METPYLDELIKDFEEHVEILSKIKQKNKKWKNIDLTEDKKELEEYKRIKEKIVNL